MALSIFQASAILFHMETIAPEQSIILASTVDGWSVAGDAYKCRAFLESERQQANAEYTLTIAP